MEEKQHLEIAEDFFQRAFDAKTVPCKAQNYFYAAINFIEAMLSRYNIHSYSHDDREKKILEILLSKDYPREILQKYIALRSARGLSGYRGVNGENLRTIEEAAKYLKTLFAGR